ncbi:MAG: elongation factor G [Balneolaceae bacterium]
MKVYEPGKVRNVALLGHSGSGKTTLAETMIFESGTTRKRGDVESKNTLSDFHTIEKEKGKSIYNSLLHLDWRGTKINLIDTPGSTDFYGQISESFAVADVGIFVLNSESGVEIGTETFWNAAEKENIPTMIVVNKLDGDNSNFQNTIDMAKERFGRGVVVVQYPYSEGEEFHAIIDVLKMTMYEFPEDGGRPDKLPIPESQRAQAELLHNELVEAIAENDEMLLDMYFEKGELDEYQMRDGLRMSLLNRDIFPVFCTCASRNMGTGRIMGFLSNVAPTPLDRKLKLENGESYQIDRDGEPSFFVFKTSSENHVGDLTYLQVTGGSIKPGMDMENRRSLDTLRIGSLYLNQGAKRVDVSEVAAGDLAVAVKLKDVHSGDTVTMKGESLEFTPINYPNTTMRVALKLKKEGDEDKLGSALNQIQKEDPSASVEHSQELQQTILHGLGEEHLNMILHQLKERFNLDVEFIRPRIPYRETITKKVDTHYKHKKQSGGAGQFAEVYLSIEPWYEGMPDRDDLNVRNIDKIDLEWGGTLVFQNCIVGGVIDNRFMPAILKGVMEKMANGPLSGCRARDIRVSVYDGSMHSVDSNEAAFKTAGLMAFKDGFLKASPQLMEPLYEVEVTLPSIYMGDVMSDLSSRRGQILGMDSEGTIQKIRAIVPLQELDQYTTRLKSLTQGSATFARKYHEHGQVPHDIQNKIIDETLAAEEE